MASLVVKFGGTSVGDINCIQAAAKKVLALQQVHKNIVVVVSAMSGETNRLESLIKAFQTENAQAYDVVVSTGEQVTTGLMVLALQDLGAKAQALQGWQVPLVTSSDFSKARCETIPIKNLKILFDQGVIPVVPGFQGVTKEGQITTLGRGGSDITAVAIAAALKAEACYLFKDVPGILASDPRIVKDPKILDRLDIEEMLEMSSQGAKVIHPRAVEAALVHDVSLKICPTFDKNGGTGIISNATRFESQTVTSIVCNMDDIRICLYNLPESPGATTCLFEAFSKANISLDMILQSPSLQGKKKVQDLTFTINQRDEKEAVALVKTLQKKSSFELMEVQPRVAKVSIVGVGLRGHANVAYVLYKTASDLGISFYGMTATELKMSVLVSNEYAPELVRALYNNFDIGDKIPLTSDSRINAKQIYNEKRED